MEMLSCALAGKASQARASVASPGTLVCPLPAVQSHHFLLLLCEVPDSPFSLCRVSPLTSAYLAPQTHASE